MKAKIKIMLADDHPVFRDGLRRMMEQDVALELVHETGNGRDALEQARRLKADMVLLDVNMPGMNGVEVARERQRHHDSFEIIFLTMHREEDLFNQAMDLGVKGYLLKDSACAEILKAVHSVAEGRPYLSPSLSEFVLNRASGAQELRTARPGLEALSDIGAPHPEADCVRPHEQGDRRRPGAESPYGREPPHQHLQQTGHPWQPRAAEVRLREPFNASLRCLFQPLAAGK